MPLLFMKPDGQGKGRGVSTPAFALPAYSYFSSFFADFATFFSGEPPDFLVFLPPEAPLTAFFTCFSIPAMRAVTLLP